MANELENGRSSILPGTIDAEIAVLAMAAKTNLEKRCRLAPKGGMSGDPMLAVLTLMANAQITRFYAGGHRGPSEITEA